MQITRHYQTENDCYKVGRSMIPEGIVVHDTAAGNPYIKRYVGPDDGKLGVNKYNNHWNKPGVEKCVHAFIGKLEDGSLACYQTLPWDMKCWGCGGGSKGSYNNTHIQFEICDDGYGSKEYFEECMEMAADLCAYLCDQYGFAVSKVVSHREAHELGYASNHSDTAPWMSRYGWTMDTFREKVLQKLKALQQEPQEEKKIKQYIVHAGFYSTREEAQAVVKKAAELFPGAYVATFDGLYYARCELNQNRDYALANAEKLEGIAERPGIFVRWL